MNMSRTTCCSNEIFTMSPPQVSRYHLDTSHGHALEDGKSSQLHILHNMTHINNSVMYILLTALSSASLFLFIKRYLKV